MGSSRDAFYDQAWHDALMQDLGLLDSGQPTITAHREHRRKMEAEFTPLERRLIRSALALDQEPTDV